MGVVFAITGNFGCGKSTVAKILKTKGAKVFDADGCVHQCYRKKHSDIYKKIKQIFPQAINKSGKICRKKIAHVVFSDKRKLEELERVIHPKVIAQLKQWIKISKTKKGVFVAQVPLLFEKKLERFFDAVILINVKNDILIRRIKVMRNLSVKEINQRLARYQPISKKLRRADFVINNDSTLVELKKEINNLWKKTRRFLNGEE